MRKPKWRIVTCRPEAYPHCGRIDPHVIILEDGYVVEFAPTIQAAWAWVADHTNGSQA